MSCEVTGTNKSLHLTMVTSAGLVHNAGWQSINNEVNIDDFFYYELHTGALFSCWIHTGARPCARLYRPYGALHDPIGVE